MKSLLTWLDQVLYILDAVVERMWQLIWYEVLQFYFNIVVHCPPRHVLLDLTFDVRVVIKMLLEVTVDVTVVLWNSMNSYYDIKLKYFSLWRFDGSVELTPESDNGSVKNGIWWIHVFAWIDHVKKFETFWFYVRDVLLSELMRDKNWFDLIRRQRFWYDCVKTLKL